MDGSRLDQVAQGPQGARENSGNGIGKAPMTKPCPWCLKEQGIPHPPVSSGMCRDHGIKELMNIGYTLDEAAAVIDRPIETTSSAAQILQTISA
jgi:hypothetical protein